ncbi:MAG: FHA domain-containing protein [Muribaculaceae bacterium]|nr:FHA domain-containing protein [Muribaculaceae bacterium]
MEKKRIKCPKCNSVLDVPFKDGEGVKHIACPVCQAKLKINLDGPKKGDNNDDDDGNETVIGGCKQYNYSVIFNGMKQPLDRGKNTIGRRAFTSNAKIQLPAQDKYFSRSHIIIEVNVDSYGNTYATLSNHMNMNGTKVNGIPIGQTDIVKLKKGDLVTMGETTIIFEAE